MNAHCFAISSTALRTVLASDVLCRADSALILSMVSNGNRNVIALSGCRAGLFFSGFILFYLVVPVLVGLPGSEAECRIPASSALASVEKSSVFDLSYRFSFQGC